MAFVLLWPDYLIFAFWLLLYSMIGIYHRFHDQISSWIHRVLRRSSTDASLQKDIPEFMFLANRQLSLFPILASVLASFLSAVSLMGTASEAYTYGMQFIFMIIAYSISFPLTSEVYMPVFYKLRLRSAQEYLDYRFNRVVRWTASLIFCIQMWIYISLALYAPALALSQVIGMPIWISLLSSGLVATFYTSLGGLRAVVWADALQLVLLTAGMVFIVVFGIVKVGGLQRLWDIAWEGKRLQSFDFSPSPFIRHTFWTLSLGGAGMCLSIFAANQIQIQRYLACKDMKTARRVILLSLPFNAIFLVVQLCAGLVAYAYFVGCDPVKTGQVRWYDQILPHLVMVLFEKIPLVRGLFLSVIYAAALSTVSSGINSLANVIIEDLILPFRQFLRKQDVSSHKVGVLAVVFSVLVGLSTIGLAFMFSVMGPRVLQFAFSLFGALGGPIFATFTLGMLVPCVNAKGGLAGLIVSAACGIWLTVGAIIYPTPSVMLPLGADNCPGNITALNSNSSQSLRSRTAYSISYLYYSPICLLVALFVGLVVSAIFGFNSRSPVPARLLAWQARAVYRRCPSLIARQWKEGSNRLDGPTNNRDNLHTLRAFVDLDRTTDLDDEASVNCSKRTIEEKRI